MSTPGKTFRIFVSSTFNDLKAERNALQERVFPELQKLCETNQCRFQAIDLRWGVSEEAALDQQTMNICLTELKRCQDVSPRPNFIILLGDRYGWMPLPPQIDASEFEEIRSQVDPEDRAFLTWDETQPNGGDGWYRLDTNAMPNEYVLRPRREEVVEEKDFNSWSETENKIRSILLGAINRLGWPVEDKRRIKYECSATHQEIIEGALKLPYEREHVFAFLRTIKNVDDLPPGSDYADTGTVKARALKDTIQQTKGVACFPYDVTWNGSEVESHIDQFVADALKSLTGIIEEELAQLKQIDALTRENIAHENFGDERCRHFVGREKILDDIAAYIGSDQQSPLVIYGQSGSGKSALMAKAVLNVEKEDTQAYMIRRFIGATPESTDIRTLLRNLCLEISKAFGFDRLKEQELAGVTDSMTEEDAIKLRDAIEKKYGVPDEYRHLVERFREFLLMVPQERQMVLFLDALDQLSGTNNAHNLNWLPSKLPANVKIVVSVLEREDDAGDCLRSARSRFPEFALLRLEDMPLDEGKQVLGRWLVEGYPERKRALTPEQMENVLLSFGNCPTPLYLKLAFEEARRWKSFEGLPNGADDVPGPAENVPGIVGDMLHRLKDERQHGKVLVETFLGLLSASRHGLSETEILELLSGDADVMKDLKARSARSPEAKGIPIVVWLRLYHDLAPYLIERSADSTVLYNFYHRVVGETVKQGCIDLEQNVRLARYFRRKADPSGDSSWSGNYVHGLAELPFQQTKSGSMWEELQATLTDLYFIEAKCKAGLVYDLVADYGSAEWAWPGREAERHEEEERQKRIKAYVDRLIEHAKDPDRSPLPEPPPLVEMQQPEPESDEEREWTALECVQAWKHFVSTHIKQLADGEESAFQMAWNSIQSGPVAKCLADIDCKGTGISFEWLRLRIRPQFRQRPVCLQILEGHTEWIVAVAISCDCAVAVSGGLDTALRVWDTATGECKRILDGHTDSIFAVSMCPYGDTAVSGSRDQTLRLWNFVTGACTKVLQGHTGSVVSVALSPDSAIAVSGSHDKTVRVWDTATGDCLRVLEGHSGYVQAVAITADGKMAISGSHDMTIRVWDLMTGMCIRVLGGHTGEIYSVSMTPDGKRAISGGEDKTLRVWNLATGKCERVVRAHPLLVYSVCITPDGKQAVTSSEDGTLRVWDISTGACTRVLRGHQDFVTATSITPDGRRCVSVSWDKTLRVWDLVSSLSQESEEGYWEFVNAVAITFDGNRAVSGGDDRILRVWNLATGQCLRELKGHAHAVSSVAIMPDGYHFISASYGETLRVWNLSTGECLRVLTGRKEDSPRRHSVSITPDGRCAVSNSNESLWVWDLPTGNCLRVLERQRDYIDSVSMTPDGRWVISGGGRTLQAWNIQTGASKIVLGGKTSNVTSISIAADGLLAVTSDDEHVLRIWDLISGVCQRKLVVHGETFPAFAIAPDCGRVVSGSWEGSLRVWDIATGRCILKHYTRNAIRSIAIHGRYIITGDERNRVSIFTIENCSARAPVVTATRLWLDEQQSWDSNLTAPCPSCGGRFVVRDDWLGQETICPLDSCAKPLRLNPFICDNSDWL